MQILRCQTGKSRRAKTLLTGSIHTRVRTRERIPLKSTQKVSSGQSTQLRSPPVLTLRQTFLSPAAVLSREAADVRVPLIYFPPWFIFPLHITLV